MDMFNTQDIEQGALDRIAAKVGEMEREYHANKDAGFDKDAKTIKDQLDGICWVLHQLGYGLYHEKIGAEPQVKSDVWLMHH